MPLYLTPPLQLSHGHATRLHSVVVLHCLGGGCQSLGFISNACNAAKVLCCPCTPIVLLSLLVTLGFVSGCNNYLFCWCLRQGFPVDSSPCIYLMFHIPHFSRSLISYFAWLLCGWSRIRETWVDGFFPGAGVDKTQGMGFFLYHS